MPEVDPEAVQRRPANLTWTFVATAAVVLASGIAYQNGLHGAFLFDDISSVQNNFQIRRLWPIWDVMWGPYGTGVAGRPVVQLSYALNYAVHELRVTGYHLVNVVVHTLNSLLLVGLLRRATGARGLALAATVVWQVHPLLTDSITYISGRTELLAGFFLLLTLYCVVRGVESGGRRRTPLWHAGAILACALGTGCKEILAIAPLLVLLYDRTFIAPSFREIFARRKPLYVGLFLTIGLIPLNLYMAQFHRWALVGQDPLNSWDYLKTQSQVLTHYLRLSAWPHPLVIDYQGWPTHPSLVEVLPYGGLIVLLLVATAFGLRRWHPAAYAGAWFFLILAPTSSLLPLPTEVATERRMYLPLIAVVALAVCAGHRALTALLRPRTARAAGACVVGLLLCAEVLATRSRNDDYRDVMAMWQDVAARQPNNSRAHTNIGYEYLARQDYAAAKQSFLRALEINPRDFTALNNLGSQAIREGDDEAALRHLREAVRVKPDFASPYANLGLVYFKLGRLPDAERNFREALRLQPNRVDHAAKLATVLNAARQFTEAERIARRAIEVDPAHAPAWAELGTALAQLRRPRDAVAAFCEAVRLAPANAPYRARLAWHLAALALDEPDAAARGAAASEAESLAESAVTDTNGQYAAALDARALACAAAGRFADAVSHASAALEVAKRTRPSRADTVAGRLAAYEAGKVPPDTLRAFPD